MAKQYDAVVERRKIRQLIIEVGDLSHQIDLGCSADDVAIILDMIARRNRKRGWVLRKVNTLLEHLYGCESHIRSYNTACYQFMMFCFDILPPLKRAGFLDASV